MLRKRMPVPEDGALKNKQLYLFPHLLCFFYRANVDALCVVFPFSYDVIVGECFQYIVHFMIVKVVKQMNSIKRLIQRTRQVLKVEPNVGIAYLAQLVMCACRATC